MQLLPVSLNPQTSAAAELSPINAFGSNSEQYQSALEADNRRLEAYLLNLEEQFANSRQKNAVLRLEVDRHHKKLQTWKHCYEEVNQEYCRTAEKLEKLTRQCQQLDPMPKTDMPNKTHVDTEQSFSHGMFKIKSLVFKKERRKGKRKQCLSLTHLPRHQHR